MDKNRKILKWGLIVTGISVFLSGLAPKLILIIISVELLGIIEIITLALICKAIISKPWLGQEKEKWQIKTLKIMSIIVPLISLFLVYSLFFSLLKGDFSLLLY